MLFRSTRSISFLLRNVYREILQVSNELSRHARGGGQKIKINRRGAVANLNRFRTRSADIHIILQITSQTLIEYRDKLFNNT